MRYCLIRQAALPPQPRRAMFLFCADHGVTAEGVSAYPQEVTRQMVMNFAQGGAAINVLCRAFQIDPVVVNVGVAGEPFAPPVIDRSIAPGTKNFASERAMSRAEVEQAIAVGRELAASCEAELVGLGEMGIGNTTSAAAVFSALCGLDPSATAGRGTGITHLALEHKIQVIRDALALHRPAPEDPLDVLSAVGGFEIAAMAGFLIEAGARHLPVVVDGFIGSVAALVACRIRPSALDTAFFSHRSAESAHGLLLERIGVFAPLDLGMRLGEGTGAALMMNLIDTAIRLYREMATFAEASVSESSSPGEHYR